jgi:hypothetical protein
MLSQVFWKTDSFAKIISFFCYSDKRRTNFFMIQRRIVKFNARSEDIQKSIKICKNYNFVLHLGKITEENQIRVY